VLWETREPPAPLLTPLGAPFAAEPQTGARRWARTRASPRRKRHAATARTRGIRAPPGGGGERTLYYNM
jgi:hypothetical protein